MSIPSQSTTSNESCDRLNSNQPSQFFICHSVFQCSDTFNSLGTLAFDKELFTMLRTVGASYWAYSLNIHTGRGSIRQDLVSETLLMQLHPMLSQGSLNRQGWRVYIVGINFLMYCFHLCSEEVAEIFRELCITITTW